MKKLLISLFVIAITYTVNAQNIQTTLIPSAATVATGTVSYTPDSSTWVDISTLINTSKPVVRITWNGTGAGTGTVTITYLTSKDGIVWDKAGDSLFNLAATVGSGTFSTSDIFNLSGVKYIAVGQIINSSGSSLTAQTTKLVFNP